MYNIIHNYHPSNDVKKNNENNENNEKLNCEKCREELEPNNLEKWKFSLIGTFLLVILFNPTMFRLMQNILGNIIGKISDKNGCPTILGYLLHALLFTLLVRYSMEMNI